MFVRRASAGLFVIAAFAVTHGCGQSKVAFTQTDKLIAPKPVVTVSAKDNNAQASLKKDAPIQNPSGPKDDQKRAIDKPDGAVEQDEAVIEKFIVKAAEASPSDFVFVVDSSGSMEPLIEKFIDGFEAIPLDKYPPNSRMAVMNMIGHKLDDPETPLAEHQYINVLNPDSVSDAMKIAKAEPGYLKFINTAGVEYFRQTVAQAGKIKTKNNVEIEPMQLNRYRLCASEWFKPSDKNGDTVAPKSCLGAAMQISGFVGTETGLLSIAQLIKKNLGKPSLFREGASVHFVLLSDTHDPGFDGLPDHEDYKRNRPKFEEIEALVKVNSNVKQVKLHGIVPFGMKLANGSLKACSLDEPNIFEASYRPEIQASGGVEIDQCQRNINYEAVVNQILDQARKMTFKLMAAASKNVTVKVNGKDWTDFKLIGENTIELGGLLSSSSYEIEVSYTKVAK